MLCTINDVYLADQTISGGFALTGLRLRMQRLCEIVVPVTINRAPLIVGTAYRIVEYHPGDNFTNVGGENVTGSIFVATGTNPTIWDQKSVVGILSPALFDRNKRKVEISFSVSRIHATIQDAETYIVDHDATIPRVGDVKLITMGTEAVIALIVNGALVRHELLRQYGKYTEHAYRILGSPLFAPTPGEDHLVTEGGDRITTEAGDTLIVE